VKKFKKGDRVQDKRDYCFGVIKSVKERGVAGSAVTYISLLEVVYDDGTFGSGDPSYYRAVDDE
jgi:hypothetical protein|tara:strand:+ start:2176 stop:2367 length:192 start_codon:yes stop_codon:yes gene_type:complete